jgi:signal peptidase I
MTAASRVASITAVLAVMLAAVWFFWPSGLGGGTAYVVTHGNSMEPGFHTGDLAILRPAGSYSVGDVVAYHSESLNTIVMHRIVSGNTSGFVTQGDNNDWLDADEPSQDEILGRLFFRVPRGGIALDAVTSPGALVFVVGGLLTVFGSAHRPRGRRRAHASGRRPTRRSPAFAMTTRAMAHQVALGSGAVALVALVGGSVLLLMPSTQTDTRTLHVTQQGNFSYTGAAESGTTYPSGVIGTGDTVWTKLAKELTVSFTNTVTGPELTEVRGTMRLDVSVTAADGWSAVLNSGPEVVLENGIAAASVPVDPAAAAALLGRHYAEIGGAGGGAALTVTPVVAMTGMTEGQRFTAASPAGLGFTLDAAALRPAGDDLASRTQTAVDIEDVVPRRFTVLDFSVPIDVARIAVAGILAVAVVTLAASAWIGRTGKGDVADRFLVRHADRILPVAALTPGPTVIDVSDVESLHRVAERFDTLVLHHAGEDADVFVVRDADATYRYVMPGSPERRRGKPKVPGSPERQTAKPPVPMPAPVPVPPDTTTPLPMAVSGPPGLEAPMVVVEPLELTAPMPLVALPSRSAGGLWRVA